MEFLESGRITPLPFTPLFLKFQIYYKTSFQNLEADVVLVDWPEETIA